MSHPNLILKRMKFPTIHIHTPRSINALTRIYKFGHYRSVLKVNKNTFFSKAYNLSMEYKNEMIPKGLVIGHLKVSKKSKKTSKSSKLKKLCIVEVGHFSKSAKSQISSKLQFLTKGPTFFHLIWSCHTTHVSYLQFHDQLLIFLFYLIFIDLIHFKSILIQIKSKNWWNKIFLIITGLHYHDTPNQIRIKPYCEQNILFEPILEALLMEIKSNLKSSMHMDSSPSF